MPLSAAAGARQGWDETGGHRNLRPSDPVNDGGPLVVSGPPTGASVRPWVSDRGVGGLGVAVRLSERSAVHDPDPRTPAHAREGDLAAFEELVRLYQADVRRFAHHATRDRALAEDGTQEAFLRAFRFLRTFRGDENPFGGTPHQDPRMVAVFERWGFIRGGTFIQPDGTLRVPAPAAGVSARVTGTRTRAKGAANMRSLHVP